jgi:hypothetical protein
MEAADFITTETGTDLIVSFAIPRGDPGDIVSLTLLRTPKFEGLMEPAERGVSISRDDVPESEDDMLRALRWESTVVTMSTSGHRRYEVDVSHVEYEDIVAAKRILGMMNADGSFKLEIIEPASGGNR